LSAKIRNLLTQLPARVLNKIQKLQKETGESVEQIVERAVDAYAKRAKSRLTEGDDELAQLMKIPKNRELFEQISIAAGRRSTALLTPAQLTARTSAGGKARAKNLTPERRREISDAANKAKREKREARLKAAKVGKPASDT
jgi:hypothetical protein